MGPMSPGSRVRTPPGALCFAGGRKSRRRQDSNLRGQSPVDFESTPLTAWVRLRVHGHLAQWQSTGLVNLGSRVRSSQWPAFPCTWRCSAVSVWLNGRAPDHGSGGCRFESCHGCVCLQENMAQQGIEPWTSRTRSENHATRPSSQLL